MNKRFEAIEGEIERRLEATVPIDSPNRIMFQDLRNDALEYLAHHDEDVAQHPWVAGLPHWDLWYLDARYEDTMFIVLVFLPEGLEFFCGTGHAFAVRRFADSDEPDDPREVFAAMSEQFNIPEGVLRLDRSAGEAWLGRSW